MPLLSIVSPVYKAEKIVPELVNRIRTEASKITNDFEIILVEDGSPDNSWNAIEMACANDLRVKGIKLSRNFGQHYAITAGLENSKGEYVVVMDCDLQDNPVYIQKLYETALMGNDIVLTYKEKREHSFFKNITAAFFYKIYNYLLNNSELETSKKTGAYSLINRKVVNAFLSISEYHRYYMMVLRMLGFKKAYISIKHEKRYEGRSTYNFKKLVSTAIDSVTSQSDKLLRLSIGLGFIIFFLSFIWAVVITIKYFTSGLLSGYASIMVTQLLGTGIILISIGITGTYIGKIFEQVKHRPLYIIDTKLNL